MDPVSSTDGKHRAIPHPTGMEGGAWRQNVAAAGIELDLHFTYDPGNTCNPY